MSDPHGLIIQIAEDGTETTATRGILCQILERSRQLHHLCEFPLCASVTSVVKAFLNY